jgi:hypothetical protein
VGIANKQALWIILSYVTLYWLSVWAIGTPASRNVVDVGGIIVGLIQLFWLGPEAIDRLLRGGGQRNWQTLFSYVLLWLGWVCFCSLTLSGRWLNISDVYPMPEFIGFSKSLMLGAGIIALFSTSDMEMPLPPQRIWFIAFVSGCSVLVGIGMGRLLGT